MILSERERRILAEIERQFMDTDPRFARTLSTPSRTLWTRSGCAAVTVLACLSALLCAALFLIGPAIVAVLLATATHHLRKRLPPRSR
jgi:DUF3040 family protein